MNGNGATKFIHQRNGYYLEPRLLGAVLGNLGDSAQFLEH
jgi:hypothetical protein